MFNQEIKLRTPLMLVRVDLNMNCLVQIKDHKDYIIGYNKDQILQTKVYSTIIL